MKDHPITMQDEICPNPEETEFQKVLKNWENVTLADGNKLAETLSMLDIKEIDFKRFDETCYKGTEYPDINAAISEFAIQKGRSPQFQEILEIIEKVNRDKGLKLSYVQIMQHLATKIDQDLNNYITDNEEDEASDSDDSAPTEDPDSVETIKLPPGVKLCNDDDFDARDSDDDYYLPDEEDDF